MEVVKFDLDTRIESAWTIPARLYTDPAVLAAEKQRIFGRTWQLAGTLAGIEQPGSYFTTEIIGEPVVVVRDLEGTLRAFHNVCRHRAGAVAEGRGCRRTFQCSYHGWTYTLDGRLIGTPEVDGMEFFDRSTMPLAPMRVETWDQFAFVNMDPAAPSLVEFLEHIPGLTAQLRLPPLVRAERRDYVIACNWKVYVDNYLEGYHIPIAHPGLMKEIDYNAYRTETWRFSSQQHTPLRPAAPGQRAERVYASDDPASRAFYFWVFPNLMLNIYPDNLSTNLIVPLGHDKTLTIFEWFFAETRDPAEREAQRRRIEQAVEFSDDVQQEDIRICEAVQKGLQSVSYDRGRYSVKRESGVHHFHALLQEFLQER
jgi:choline monooxygenase